MPAVAHGIENTVVLACTRQTVGGHVHQTAPAVVDLDVGQLRKHLHHRRLQHLAALGIGAAVGHGKARPAAEQQAVVRGEAEVVADQTAGHVSALMRKQLVDQRLRQHFGDDHETADRHDASAIPAQPAVLAGAGRQQHLPGLNRPLGGVDHKTSTVGFPVLDRSVLIHPCAMPHGGIGQAQAKAAHVHLHAVALQQAAVKFV
ncbi:hypothetical protein ALP29_200473 [Pseudomonas syringae pv. avii]|uniref:Uncharacterized protein n=1 Tax=Pseudomonas syringae pv. avii TaxID=663959 RepID=A0A3M5W364_PSESX|nr:hypothetical protein ALP29_200473 [Pseudomonas syringae pv. avii]